MVILVIDDDLMSRKMLRFLLEGEGFEVIIAETIRAARSILTQTTPLLIILDVALPDGSGFSLCQWLAKEEPQVPVIILTAFTSQNDRLNGFRYGADDYIIKPYDPSELVLRVKALLRRTSRVQSHLIQDNLRVGDLELSVNELKVKKIGSKDIELTPTEMKILSCFMVNVGVVLDRGTIAENALGMDYGGSSNIVDVYVRRLRKKLETDPNNPQYIETVVGSGYRLSKL